MGGVTPSLAEAARRLLRSEGGILEVPENYYIKATNIALQINDQLPQLINEPQVVKGVENQLRLFHEGKLLFLIGGDEPDLSTCWIPVFDNDFDTSWEVLSKQISDLLVAGYPGCIGCAGPAATEPWDEKSRREIFLAGLS